MMPLNYSQVIHMNVLAWPENRIIWVGHESKLDKTNDFFVEFGHEYHLVSICQDLIEPFVGHNGVSDLETVW